MRARLSPFVPRARGRRPAAGVPAPRHAAERGPEARSRAAGGPQDTASYTCSCGYVFEAHVSTSVACPHCGASQAW